MIEKELENYWSNRYQDNLTGWDIGYPSTPLKEYFDQLESKELKILIPGAGNAYEAEYLFNNGFKNVHILDIAEFPLRTFKKRVPNFPDGHLHQENFFEHMGQYDLIIEQTFFCSFEPTKENRRNYARQMDKLLLPSGKLVGLWFTHQLKNNGKRPFGGSKDEYLSYLNPYFSVRTFEECYNSIDPRSGKELFGIFEN